MCDTIILRYTYYKMDSLYNHPDFLFFYILLFFLVLRFYVLYLKTLPS